MVFGHAEVSVVIGCCGLMDDGSVQQQRGVIGINVYRHEGDDNGKVSVDYLKRCRFVYRQKRPSSAEPAAQRDQSSGNDSGEKPWRDTDDRPQ